MKGGVAMMLAALLHAKAEGFVPPGDILLVVLSDEEGGGNLGPVFWSRSTRTSSRAIREFGGFTLTVGGERFYPIQVAKKQICWLKAIFDLLRKLPESGF
ncbi:MAG TPA: M20/M25/M40 family metallo-hydrolase [Anaerolineaceae bacterium]|nr:M20/M25/M40 family metallo-hydrolase [Anaerolineales bacterium]HIQ09625.1 M20/M25/M40 family metallo-hydrolase [Anaerolineaceae bacterium]